MTTARAANAARRPMEFFPLSTERIVDLELAAGRSTGDYICDLLASNGLQPQPGDVLAVTSKIASFFEGTAVRLSDVRPSRKARILGRFFRKDPREVQVLMEVGRVAVVIPMRWLVRYQPLWRSLAAQSANPEAMRRGFFQDYAFTFMVAAHGTYLDDAGIDYSNAPAGVVTVLPKNPCAVAAGIRTTVNERFGTEVAVILTDTSAKFGRFGSNDVAIGYAGMDAITRLAFSDDLFGVPRSGGVDVVIDSIAAMAGLAMGQTTELTPAVLVRGVAHRPPPRGTEDAGMRALTYPAGTLWRGVLLTLVASAGFRAVNLLTFQRWPRRTRA